VNRNDSLGAAARNPRTIRDTIREGCWGNQLKSTYKHCRTLPILDTQKVKNSFLVDISIEIAKD